MKTQTCVPFFVFREASRLVLGLDTCWDHAGVAQGSRLLSRQEPEFLSTAELGVFLHPSWTMFRAHSQNQAK